VIKIRLEDEQENEFEIAEKELRKTFGKEPAPNDVIWKVYNQRLLENSSKKLWGLYRNTKLDMALLLIEEGKYKQALATLFEICFLDLNGPCNFPQGITFNLKYPEFDPKFSFLAPEILRMIKREMTYLRMSDDEAKKLFIEVNNQSNIKNKLVMPLEEAWRKIHYKLVHEHKNEYSKRKIQRIQPRQKEEVIWREIPKGAAKKLYENLLPIFNTNNLTHPIIVVDHFAELSKDYVQKVKCLIQILIDYIEKYERYEKFIITCKLWLSDCYFLLGDYESALNNLSQIELFRDKFQQFYIISINRLYLLKLQNKEVSAYEILTSTNMKDISVFTDYVRKYPEEYLNEINSELSKIKKEQGNILNSWAKPIKEEKQDISPIPNADPKNGNYWLFTLGSELFTSIGVNRIWFYVKLPFRIEPNIEQIKQILRNAENNLRTKKGVPKVGEGWVSETELYQFVKNSFPNYTVIHHYKANWLGKQHLDIFITDLNLAIEFQGEQHFESVDFFGGEKAFQKRKMLDELKREKCKQNQVSLIEVTSEYNQKKIIEKIKNLKAQQ